MENNSTSSTGDSDVVIGGVYCGKDIGDGLLREELGERRFVIRQRVDSTYARRLGEVCGGSQYGGGYSYQATRNDGSHVANRTSFVEAAKTLIQHKGAVLREPGQH